MKKKTIIAIIASIAILLIFTSCLFDISGTKDKWYKVEKTFTYNDDENVVDVFLYYSDEGCSDSQYKGITFDDGVEIGPGLTMVVVGKTLTGTALSTIGNNGYLIKTWSANAEVANNLKLNDSLWRGILLTGVYGNQIDSCPVAITDDDSRLPVENKEDVTKIWNQILATWITNKLLEKSNQTK